MSERPILEVRNVSKNFGGIVAVHDVSFGLAPGEIVGLIGPNGAGKTTIVNLITGIYPPNQGRILFDDEDITRMRSYRIARAGIARTFQIVQPFPAMTVLENVTAGVLFAHESRDVGDAKKKAHEHLEFVGLAEMADVPATSLTLPNRKRLELAKGLAMHPRVLLLDEVNAGLNPAEIDTALDLIRQISARGITILIIEHLMKVVFPLSHRILVLHNGALISEGTPAEVAKDQKVVAAYLGSKFAEREKELLGDG